LQNNENTVVIIGTIHKISTQNVWVVQETKAGMKRSAMAAERYLPPFMV
jgi:hypothetical protein